MERIQSLINKLQEQYSQQADASQMLMTLQLLQAEMNNLPANSKKLGTSKVAVVMPAASKVNYPQVLNVCYSHRVIRSLLRRNARL